MEVPSLLTASIVTQSPGEPGSLRKRSIFYSFNIKHIKNITLMKTLPTFNRWVHRHIIKRSFILGHRGGLFV